MDMYTADDVLQAYACGERRFTHLKLTAVDLRGADLRDANFYGSDLSNADLSGADLSRANLGKADLYNANLSGANLSGAFYQGANLTKADMSSVITNNPSSELEAKRATGVMEPPLKPSEIEPTEAADAKAAHFCIHCGTSLPASAQFCPACGRRQLAATSALSTRAPEVRTTAGQPARQSKLEKLLEDQPVLMLFGGLAALIVVYVLARMVAVVLAGGLVIWVASNFGFTGLIVVLVIIAVSWVANRKKQDRR